MALWFLWLLVSLNMKYRLNVQYLFPTISLQYGQDMDGSSTCGYGCLCAQRYFESGRQHSETQTGRHCDVMADIVMGMLEWSLVTEGLWKYSARALIWCIRNAVVTIYLIFGPCESFAWLKEKSDNCFSTKALLKMEMSTLQVYWICSKGDFSPRSCNVGGKMVPSSNFVRFQVQHIGHIDDCMFL